jgi:hypothetical protein
LNVRAVNILVGNFVATSTVGSLNAAHIPTGVWWCGIVGNRTPQISQPGIGERTERGGYGEDRDW